VTRVLALCLALVSAGCDLSHKYPPDELCKVSGAWVYHRESICAAITGPIACPEIDRVATAGLQLCPAAKRDDLRSDLGALRVDLYGKPVRCGGTPAWSCQETQTHITASTGWGAAWEVCRVVWERCEGGSGEDVWTRAQDPAFAAWCTKARGGR